METLRFVLVTATVIVPAAAGIYGYQAAIPAFTPSIYNSQPYSLPQSFPFRPLFSYAFQEPAQISPYVIPVPATTVSRMIYSANQPSKDKQMGTFRGFSYQTKYSDGGNSEVTFVTGPDSKQLMEQNNAFFRQVFIPPPKSLNDSISETSANSNQTAQAKTKNTPLPPGAHQSSVYRLQVFPANTVPLLGAPIPLHSIVSSYHHTFRHSPLNDNANDDSSDNYQENAEGQESMISEIGRILAGDQLHKESLITSDENNISLESPTKSLNETAQDRSVTTKSNNTTELPNENNVTSELSKESTDSTTQESSNEEDGTEESSNNSQDHKLSEENAQDLSTTTNASESSSVPTATADTESHSNTMKSTVDKQMDTDATTMASIESTPSIEAKN